MAHFRGETIVSTVVIDRQNANPEKKIYSQQKLSLGNLEGLLFPNDAKATPVPQEAKIESAVPPNESALPALTKPTATDTDPVGGTEPKINPPEPPVTDGTDAKPEPEELVTEKLSPEPVPKLSPPVEGKGIEGKQGKLV